MGLSTCHVTSVRSVQYRTRRSIWIRSSAERGAIACPTLVTYQALKDEGASLGLPAESVNKIDDVRTAGLRSLEIMREAGLMMAFGTDLLGEMHRHQSSEFVIRGEVLPAIEVIRSTTINAAKLLMSEGKIGCIAPGAYADLVVVEGDPLNDLSLLPGGWISPLGRVCSVLIWPGTMPITIHSSPTSSSTMRSRALIISPAADAQSGRKRRCPQAPPFFMPNVAIMAP